MTEGPRPSLLSVAGRFLRLGALAFGGPVAQIGALHEELVVRERWVDEPRFRRALAVYQALPGPEATEMCIWFGTVARGRLGGLVAGLGFVLPGLLLMLLACSLLYGTSPWPPWLASTFGGMQAAAVAMVLRATWRLGQSAIGRRLVPAAIASGALLASIASAPFGVVLVAGGLAAAAAATARPLVIATAAAAVAAVVVLPALPATAVPGTGAGDGAASTLQLAASGLRAGLLTFGGAYTAIPFLESDAVGPTGWMSAEQFLSGLAVGAALPAPMVVAGTWVGWAGGGPGGALLLTLGIFLPAFVFPLLLHPQLERLVANARVHAFLDGVTAAVLGLIAATALELAGRLVASPVRIAIAAAALLVLLQWRHRLAVLPVMALAAGAGWLHDAAARWP